MAQSRSQVVELYLSLCERLGIHDDRELAELAEVSVETIANWRTGAVSRLKLGKLDAIKRNLGRYFGVLLEHSRLIDESLAGGLNPLSIEDGSGPAELQRQFREMVAYDYLGHRFLYFEPQGALAWENLIKQGYEQRCWLAGVEDCARSWLDRNRASDGSRKGPLADDLLDGRRGPLRGLDVISLGPGEGSKERLVLKELQGFEDEVGRPLRWLTYAPVDVSIPLLLKAARVARETFAGRGGTMATRWRSTVLPFCADFEEGPLSFAERLPTASELPEHGRRLVLLLGNVLGNLRDEGAFVERRLRRLVRVGDWVWVEVGIRLEPIARDPLYRMTESPEPETAAETHRRLLLEGPYRRWESALGRRPSSLSVRISVREDDESARVPGSCNFCHDLIIEEERRMCTMLYSRRYSLEGLSRWLEQRGFDVVRVAQVKDSTHSARVAHLLLWRRT